MQKTSGLRSRHAFTRWQWLASGLTLALVLVALLAPLPIRAAAPQERRLSITASQWDFQPGTVRVNRGDRVTIELDSVDVMHGLFVDGYEIKTVAEPGRPGVLTFVADRDGAFHFRCAVPCGNLHPFMIGKLVVGPNLTWLRAVTASILAAVGALAILWRR
ncbi:MAG: cupredoxin domain-containing protein [Chloroflexi bacterium]|nr:cupredoxin domain-containing protein [Chloroflexota bacterium]